MQKYVCDYFSKIGILTMVASNNGLYSLQLKGQKYFKSVDNCIINDDFELFCLVKSKLDLYFSGKNPDFSSIPLVLEGSTFQKEVWEILKEIPHGKTAFYGEIAQKIANKKGVNKMSPQAAGNAISKNPILIIIPCHRVIAKNGDLRGFSAGIDTKKKLLEIEGCKSEV